MSGPQALIELIPNPVPWPDGAKCAVCFSWDLDADSLIHIARPQDADTFVSTQSMLRYGPLVAVDRICRVFRAYGLKQTFFVPAWCIERYEQAIDRILSDGHEIGHHSYIHEQPNQLSADDERYWFERALATFDRRVGIRPKGYRAPLNEFSKHTLSLLIEHGFEYDSSLMGDDLPYVIGDSVGQIIELPQYIANDDWPQFMHSWDMNFQMTINPPARAKELYLSEFDVMWESGGGLWMTVWHPFLAGRPARIKMMIEMIEHMLSRGSIWFASLGEINAHIRKLMAEGSWAPRRDTLPYDRSPIPELFRSPDGATRHSGSERG